ncbi:patatin-like phospholipase family protein [bacterium]|nr:patatin-like phospholipase family protein [bacterium]
MKYLKLVVLLLLICATTARTTERPSVGLVLCGGGAKGFAHIGVLKVLEEAEIPIDYIAGTSIGSIVGGLYACGYDAAALDTISRTKDWLELFNDDAPREFLPLVEKAESDRTVISFPLKNRKLNLPPALMYGQNVINLFCDLTASYHEVTDFRDLPIPFICIATNLEDGREAVLDSGYLPEAILASMAVPAVFEAVEIGDKLLVDGGVVNNMPVDRIKAFGADIVIVIDIDRRLQKKVELNSLDRVVRQLITFQDYEKTMRNRKLSDLIITPDLRGIQATNFSRSTVDTLISQGEKKAREMWPELIALREKYNLQEKRKTGTAKSFDLDKPVLIRYFKVNGNPNTDLDYIQDAFGYDGPRDWTIRSINEGIRRLYGTLNFNRVYYKITGDELKTLELFVKERNSRTFNAGFRFDTYKKAAILFNITARKLMPSVSRFSMNLELSATPGFDASYLFGRYGRPRFSTKVWVKDSENEIYIKGKKVGDFDILYSGAECYLNVLQNNDYQLGVGLRDEFFQMQSILGEALEGTRVFRDKNFVQYFVFANMDRFDNKYFPTNGRQFSIEYQAISEGGANEENNPGVSVISTTFRDVNFLTRNVYLLPSFYVRSVLTEDFPVVYGNFVGGERRGEIFKNRLPFLGLKRMEPVERNVAIGRADLRFNPMEDYYVTLSANVLVSTDHFQDWTLHPRTIWGGGLTLAYNTELGPFELSFSRSAAQKGWLSYINIGFWF